jgi:hypothetical protein
MLLDLLNLFRRPDVGDTAITPNESHLARWAAQVVEAVEKLEAALYLPPAPRVGDSPDQEADALLALLARLGCNMQSPNPAAGRNARFQANARHALNVGANAVEESLLAIDRALGALAGAGRTRRLLTPGGPAGAILSTPGGGVHACVDVAKLPAGHPAKDLLPRDQLLGGPPTVLVLGPVGRPWYSAEEAKTLTRHLAAEDRATKEAVRRQVEGRFEKEEAAARARWERSPEGREARLNERLAALEAAGKAG